MCAVLYSDQFNVFFFFLGESVYEPYNHAIQWNLSINHSMKWKSENNDNICFRKYSMTSYDCCRFFLLLNINVSLVFSGVCFLGHFQIISLFKASLSFGFKKINERNRLYPNLKQTLDIVSKFEKRKKKKI